MKGGPQPGGLCSPVGGDRHESKAQSSEMSSSNRAVRGVHLRHHGGQGREAFIKELAFDLCLEPKSGGFHKESGRTRHPG